MQMNREVVTIVSGLPRSGTSMMMSMLVAGGVEALTDNLREADDDNPRGYLEFERVKDLAKDKAWLKDAAGKAVKVVSSLLQHLPPEYDYKVIFMLRKVGEVLASQKQMLVRRGQPTDEVSDERMAEAFRRHLKDVQAWLARQPNVEVVYVDYNELLENHAASVQTINQFLGGGLDTPAMVLVIDKRLYRQREMVHAGVAPQGPSCTEEKRKPRPDATADESAAL